MQCIWHQTKNPGPFNGSGEFSLVSGAKIGSPARHNPHAGRHKTAQSVGVFVINDFAAGCAKEALFLVGHSIIDLHLIRVVDPRQIRLYSP